MSLSHCRWKINPRIKDIAVKTILRHAFRLTLDLSVEESSPSGVYPVLVDDI